MAVKELFSSFHRECEQNLVDGLIEECIQVHGINVYYIPRTLVNEDYLFGEDPISSFDDGFEIEMYLETFDQYDGDGDLLSRFGLHIKDQATLTVHATRFTTETEMDKPLEGDLIYMPLSKVILEVKFVEHEEQFYALGRNYQFKLQCQLFEYSREDFNTGIEDVDIITDNLDDSEGEVGQDLYGDQSELESEGDAAVDNNETHLFGGG